MADIPFLAERLFNQPLLVTPSYAKVVVSALADRLGVQPLLRADEVAVTPRPARDPMLIGDILVLPIVGGLYHRGDALDAMSGSNSYTNLSNRIFLAIEDPKMKGILLDIDSPGGQATGCFEFADQIAAASKKKPIWSIANGLAASAAYALACSAERFYMTPSGEVGSIGVVTMHIDASKALAKAGLVTTYIYAGEHKIDGNPTEPLPKDVKARIQTRVDERYRQFVSLVAARRPMTEEDVIGTKADTFLADEAMSLNMVDGVMPFGKVLSEFQASLSSPGTSPTPKVTTGVKMAQQTAPDAGATAAALDAARKEGFEAGKKDGFTAGVKAEADRREAIMALPEAAKKKGSAAALASDPGVTVDMAKRLLLSLPEDGASGAAAFRDKLSANDPPVKANVEAVPVPKEDRLSGVRKYFNQAIAAKTGAPMPRE